MRSIHNGPVVNLLRGVIAFTMKRSLNKNAFYSFLLLIAVWERGPLVKAFLPSDGNTCSSVRSYKRAVE